MANSLWRKVRPGLVKVKHSLGWKEPLRRTRYVGDWERLYGRPKPKIVGLIGRPRCGSHLVLHRLQGHPNLLALKEFALSGDDLISFFVRDSYPLQSLLDNQLLPKKDSLAGIEAVILNKPQPSTITYHDFFHHDRIMMFFCFRNPVGLYRSWNYIMSTRAQKTRGRPADKEFIDRWFEATFLSSLFDFAQHYDPQRDRVINFEAFVANQETSLGMLWKALGVENLGLDQLAALDRCEVCGRPLERKEADLRHAAAALYCPKCDRIYLGPGGYNYIRPSSVPALARWKEDEQATELKERFSRLVGGPIMDYYQEEQYVGDPDHSIFSRLFDRLMNDLRDRAWPSHTPRD
jgi:hypothetical protein